MFNKGKSPEERAIIAEMDSLKKLIKEQTKKLDDKHNFVDKAEKDIAKAEKELEDFMLTHS